MNELDTLQSTMDPTKGQLTKTTLIAVIICVSLVSLVILEHNLSFKSTIVLPAGGTYLGPTAAPSSTPSAPQAVTGTDIRGHKYPYAFKVPESIKLVSLASDTFDIYALVIGQQPPDQNVLIGVDDMRRTEELKVYAKGNKRTYVENWWKQFAGLKGIASVDEFTNSNGLKGYRAKFINTAGATPNDDIFFEVSDPNYVIHLANGPLEKTVFEKIVDSVAWPARNASRSDAGGAK